MKLNRHALDEFIAESDRRGGPSSPECAEFWKDLFYEPSAPIDAQLRPRSNEYKQQQLALYRELTGHDYFAPRDEAVGSIPTAELLSAPNAYDHSDPVQFAKHYVAMGMLVQELRLPRGSKVRELGSGWGFTQEFLSTCGYKVSGVEINPAFVEISNLRLNRLGFEGNVFQSAFDSFDVGLIGPQDAIVAYEALHHAVDAEEVIKKYSRWIKPNGFFALAAEPFNTYYRTWGLRLDACAVYSTRKFGWFESGWSVDYMAYLLGRHGMEARFVELSANELTRYMIGTISNRQNTFQLGMWDPAIAEGWWVDQDYCCSKGDSQLMLSPPDGATGARFEVANFKGSPINAFIRLGKSEQSFSIAPGRTDLEVGLKPALEVGDDIILGVTCDTYCPAELGINTDSRRLGIHISGIEWI